MSEERVSEDGTAIIGKVLVPQMGSDSQTIEKGLIDQRKFAVITEGEQVALAHFSYRAEYDKNRYFGHLVEWILNSSPSIGGLGRKQTISLTAAASGSGRPDTAKQPNVLARNLWNRNWREKAESQGKEVVE